MEKEPRPSYLEQKVETKWRRAVPLEEIPAVVLCGGWGSRIKDVTGDITPKPLIRINRSHAILDYPLDFLQKAGIKRVILATSLSGIGLLKKHLKADCDLDTQYSVQRLPAGVIQAVEQSLWEEKLNEWPFILIHGDEIITGASLQNMYNQHVITNAPITEVLTGRPEAGNNYVMWDDQDLRVTKIKRHPSFLERQGGFTGTGIFIFSPGVFPRYQICNRWEELVFTACQKRELFGYLTGGEFFNINTPTELSLARNRLSG